MRLLIVGGTADHPGGVETFSRRAASVAERSLGWRVTLLPSDTAYLRVRTLGRLMRGLARFVRACRQRPDCVWVQYVNLPDLAYVVLGRVMRQAVLVTPHLGANWRSLESGTLRGISRRALGRADRVALLSPTQEREIALPDCVPRSMIRTFLPEAVLRALEQAAERPATLQLVHACRLSEGKGTLSFVEVCAALRRRGVAFAARIIGGADAAFIDRLHSLIAERGLTDMIAVLGRLEEALLLAELRRADILVHLSRIDSYPLIVLEALACGATPLCLDLAGARDMVETYGGGLIADTAGESEAAADWIAGQDLAAMRARSGGAAARVRGDFAWDRCAALVADAVGACVRPVSQAPSSG